MRYASQIIAPGDPYPVPQRLAKGWSAFPVPKSPEAAILRWDSPVCFDGPGRLRLTVASDVREIVRVAVSAAGSGRLLGDFDLRYSYVSQIHELRLDAEDCRQALKEGVVLHRLEGQNPIWIFWRQESAGLHALCPHLLPETQQDNPWARLVSPDSLQPFGWLEGCVLDGLLEGSRRCPEDPRFSKALHFHLDSFAGPDGSLAYEDPRNVPCDGRIYGEEGPLPLAIVALTDPHSPWLQIGEDFFETWLEKLRVVGSERDQLLHLAETSYTCAYTLAAFARAGRGRQWDVLAARHLQDQRDVLVDSKGGLWLRHNRDGSRADCHNWARAHAWYLLGLARTLPLIRHLKEASELEQEFRRACTWVENWQLSNGLWAVFVNEPSLVPDTSGSAGIAAAFALGAREGILPIRFTQAARRTLAGLNAHLTPDGFLGGCSQSNKGGEELQRSPYRVIAQFAQGLHALLTAALDERNQPERIGAW